MKPNVVVFLCALTTFLAVSLACGIVWVLIGVDNLSEGCLDVQGTPNIAVWTVVEGSTLLGMAVLLLCFLPCLLIKKVKQNTPAADLLLRLVYLVLVVYAFFHLAWLIVGAVRLSQADTCDEDSDIRRVTLAAVIIRFVFFPLPFCFFPGSKSDD